MTKPSTAALIPGWKSPVAIAAILLGLAVLLHAATTEPSLIRRHVHIYGSLAGKLSFLAALLLPFLMLQRRKLNLPPLSAVTRLLRKWHIPVAIFILCATAAHIYLATVNGLAVNFRNVTGLLALIPMVIVYYSGAVRKGNWRKIHLTAGLSFIGILLLHMA